MAGRRRVAIVLAKGAIRVAKLGDDLVGSQVAREALLARRAKGAVHGATSLRRDTERAAIGFGDEDGFDRVAAADVEQPLAGTVVGHMVGNDTRLGYARALREQGAKRLGEVAHGGEVVLATLVNPAQELVSPEGLFTPRGTTGDQCLRIESEQVGLRGHGSRHPRLVPRDRKSVV